MNKQAWLSAAEVFDAWRVIPRVVLLGFAAWTIHIFDLTLHWYFVQPAAERSVQDAGMVTALLSAITGLFTMIVKFYVNTGRNWDSGESSTTTMTATRTSP